MPLIPLDDDDMVKIARLALTWECSPAEALSRSLDRIVAVEFDPPDDEAREAIRESPSDSASRACSMICRCGRSRSIR